MFKQIDNVEIEVDVNLLFLGFDRYNSDFSSLQNGILEKLNSHKIQRFLEVKGATIQEHAGSHVDYRIHYHVIQLHPLVQVYFRHLMEYISRDIDMNLMNVKIINPYEIVEEVHDLFQFVRQNTNNPVPNEKDMIMLVMNSQLDLGGTYGFSTEFSYTELQKMIDEIFREGSEFAVSDFVFPLTEPLTFTDAFESSDINSDHETTSEGLHPVPSPSSPSSSSSSTASSPSSSSSSSSSPDYCFLDWREISFQWVYDRDIKLQQRSSFSSSRSSSQRIHRNLDLLLHAYNKKEQRRILIEMKQVLGNDYLMNEKLVNMIEGTHVVSDYFFIDQFFLMDVGAGPFEWGSIHDESNIRTKNSILMAKKYASSLRYFNTTQEIFLNYAEYIEHLIQQSCKQQQQQQQQHKVTQEDICAQSRDQVSSTLRTLRGDGLRGGSDYQRIYHSLLLLEQQWTPSSPSLSSDTRLTVEEMEVTIHLTHYLSDVISHFVTPPFILDTSVSDTSATDPLSTLPAFIRIPPASLATPPPSTIEEVQAILDQSIGIRPPNKEKLHFQVNYFTREDFEDYFTVDENYFDYSVFRSEIERLKLPSQEFFFSFQALKLENEPRLQTALLKATTTSIIPHLSNNRRIFPVQQTYINSTVLFEATKSNNHALASRDIQIYIFCLTGTSYKPILLDRSELAVFRTDGSNQMVFAVQNEMVSTNSPYFVNHIPLHYNLHDIMTPLLSCIFDLLSNTNLNLYFGDQIHTHLSALTEDCVFRSIGSVDRVFSANHVYSSFHIAIIQKSQFILSIEQLISEYNHLMVGKMRVFNH